MEKYYLQSIGVPVITEEGARAGTVKDILIDPETGKVCAFSVSKRSKRIIAPADILKWNNKIIIHDQFDIVEPEEISNACKIIENNIPIYRNMVYTQEGEYIGKVTNIGIDNNFFILTCLIVAKTAFGIFEHNEKIITAKDIIEITAKKIIVKNLVRPVKIKKLKVDIVPTT